MGVFSAHLPLTSQMDVQQHMARAHVSARLVRAQRLPGLSSRFRPFSRRCASFLQPAPVTPTERGRVHPPRHQSLQERHHPHQQPVSFPGWTPRTAPADPDPHLRRCSSTSREAARGSLGAEQRASELVLSPRLAACPPPGRGECWEKAPQQLQGWVSICRVAGIVTWVRGSSRAASPAPVQFYSEKTSQVLWHRNTSGRGGVCTSSGQPTWARGGFHVTYNQIWGREGQRCINQVGDRLPFCVTSAAQPGQQGSSRGDRHR